MTRRKKVYLLETDNGFVLKITDPDIRFMKKFRWTFIDNNLVISRRLNRGEESGFTEIKRRKQLHNVYRQKRKAKQKLYDQKRGQSFQKKIRRYYP